MITKVLLPRDIAVPLSVFVSPDSWLEGWISLNSHLGPREIASDKKDRRGRGESNRAKPLVAGLLIENQHGRGDYCSPEGALVAHRGLSHVRRAHDLIRQAVDLFLLIP